MQAKGSPKSVVNVEPDDQDVSVKPINGFEFAMSQLYAEDVVFRCSQNYRRLIASGQIVNTKSNNLIIRLTNRGKQMDLQSID